MISFIFAGTETTHYSAQIVTSILTQKPEILAKVRKEYTEAVYEPAVQEDASLSSLPLRELLFKTVDLISVSELEYGATVIQEAMRICPAAPGSHFYEATKDLTLGKYPIQKGDILMINFMALGHSPDEWQRPMEILPERFNPKDPLFLRPDGKRRSTYAMAPFHGGSRVCFGKTLAEAELKIFLTFMSQNFDFEFENKEYMTEIPLACAGMSSHPPVWMNLTKRKK